MTPVRRAVLAGFLACTALLTAGPTVNGGGAIGPIGGGATPGRTLELRLIAAQPSNRAAVIVDTGDGSAPKKVCIRFDANTISGEEALRLAAAEDPSIAPVFADFSGKGKAVCALCGVGCPSGDCFCDPARYWAYSRADSGSGAFAASPVGVSASQVTDGDVEGYRWGSGAAPALADIRTICGEVQAETTTTAPPPPPPPRPPPPPAPVPPPAPGPTAPAPTAPAPTAPAPTAPGPTAPAPTAPAPAPGSPGAGVTTTSAPGQSTTSTTEPPTSATSAPGVEEVPTDGEEVAGGDPDVIDPEAGGDDGADGTGEDAADDGEDELASPGPVDQGGGDQGGGSVLGLAGVGATLVALVAGSAALQRARRRG